MGYNLGYVIYWGYNPFTNLLLSSWHIQVQAPPPWQSSHTLPRLLQMSPSQLSAVPAKSGALCVCVSWENPVKTQQNTTTYHMSHPFFHPTQNLNRFASHLPIVRHNSTGIPLSCNSALCSSCLTVAAASLATA